MAYVPSPGFEETLGSFIRGASVSSAYTPGRFDKILYFFNDILIYAHIPITIDTFIWYILLCFFDFFMIYISTPFGWFDPIDVSVNSESNKYLLSKTWLQRFAIIEITLLLIFIVYFWYVCFQYHPRKQHLTAFTATLLYSIIYYMPLIFIPLCGFLFGVLLFTNIQEEKAQYSITVITAFLSLSFVILLATVSMSYQLTRCSLTLRNGQFAFWRPPFQSLDYVVLFITAGFYPFRMVYEPRSSTLIAVIQFVYGIHFLIALRNVTFISLIPLTIQIKISLDIMIFSIFTVVNVWFQSTYIVIFSVFIVLSFICTCLSLFVLAILIENSNAKIATLTSTKLPSTKDSISMLRMAVNLSITDVTRFEVIKSIALWRFSYELVPDIVRYCLVTRQSIKDVVIPRTCLGSIQLSPFQFLSFQVERFECYSAQDDSPQVEAKLEELNQLMNHSEIILDNFWTDPSFDQMDVYALGIELEKISNKFAFGMANFPHSKKICDIFEFYNREIVHVELPSYLKHHNPMELLYNPGATIYGYLCNSKETNENKRPLPVEKKETTIDWYLKSVTKKSMTPLLVFYVVFFLAFIAIMIVFDHFSYMWTQERLNHFVNTSTFLRLQTELSNEKLAFIDPFVDLPSYHEIVDLLGIDEETASILCLSRIQSREQFSDLTSLYTYIPSFPRPSNPGKCKYVSLFLLLKYQLHEKFTDDVAFCRLFYLNFYSQYIAEKSEEIFWDFNIDLTIGKVTIGIFISLFIFVSSVLFAVFLYNDVRNQKRMISTVKTISLVNKQNRNLKTKSYNIGLGISYSIIIWIVLMSFIAILFTICQIPTEKENKKVARLLHQISIISRITRTAQDSLAFREVQYTSKFDIPGKNEYLSYSREDLVNLVDLLSETGIDRIFQSIKPLDKWSVNGKDSFSSILLDFAQLLSNTTEAPQFRFLYARYIFLFNISSLIQSALPEMVTKALFEIQKVTAVYNFSYFAIFVSVSICMVFFYFLYSRKKVWYYATTTYLRRSILKDSSCFQLIQKMLSNPKVNFLEELPFPFIICDRKTGVILYSNTKITDYIQYTTNQIIGQKLENVLQVENNLCTVDINGKSSILKLHIDIINQNYTTISLTNVTDVHATYKAYKEMVSIMRPNIPTIPYRAPMVYIKILYEPKKPSQQAALQLQQGTQPYITKYNTHINLPTAAPPISNTNDSSVLISSRNSFLNNASSNTSSSLTLNESPLANAADDFGPEFLFNIFDHAELTLNGEIDGGFAVRISCGASFYSAIVRRDVFDENTDKFLEFLSILTEKAENDFVASVVFGVVSCLSLDDDETRVVVCGETARRANDCAIYGAKNRIYMDDVIASSFIGNDRIQSADFLNESLIVISPTVRPQL